MAEPADLEFFGRITRHTGTQELRQHRLPIIFVTAYPEDRIRARALEAGAVDFLTILTNYTVVLDYQVSYYRELANYQMALANLEPLELEIAKYIRWERFVHPLRFLNLVPLSHVFGQFMALFVPPLLGGVARQGPGVL